MALPGFTAALSDYATHGRYRNGEQADAHEVAPPGETLTLAYMPGAETQRECSRCSEKAIENYGICMSIGEAGCAIGCALSGPFWPACFAACTGAALGSCNTKLLAEQAICQLPGNECCPKLCGFPNPFEPGSGCCEANETCVDQNDSESRRGCCPAGRAVCGGRCCPKDHRCCGETCCPPDMFCVDGSCTYPSFGNGPPPIPPERRITYCMAGEAECNGKCCPRGTECCPDGGCKTTCLH